MRSPKRAVFLGPKDNQTRVELAGDIFACIEYEEVSGGDSLEQLAINLDPDAVREGNEVTVSTSRLDSRKIADLLFAFSATWRDDTGWNSRHNREGDPKRHPRERVRYIDLVKLMTVADKRRVASILLALLIETVFPPGETVTECGPPARDEQRPHQQAS